MSSPGGVMVSDDKAGITNVLFDKGVLVDLDIGRWTPNTKLTQDDIRMTSIDEDAYRLGHKKLLNKKALDPVSEVERKARAALKAKSSTFPLSGARFVSKAALPAVVSKLEGLKTEYEARVEEFLAKYEDFKKEQLDQLDAQLVEISQEDLNKLPSATTLAVREAKEKELVAWVERKKQENRQLYPDLATLKQKFRFQWRVFKISPVEGVGKVGNLHPSAPSEALKKEMQEWVKEATTAMHKALGDAALHAKTTLESSGKLTGKNLNPLFQAFESFNALEFTGESGISATISKLKEDFAELDSNNEIDMKETVKEIEKNKTAFNQILSTLAELAEDDKAEAAGVAALTKSKSFSRALDLSDLQDIDLDQKSPWIGPKGEWLDKEGKPCDPQAQGS